MPLSEYLDKKIEERWPSQTRGLIAEAFMPEQMLRRRMSVLIDWLDTRLFGEGLLFSGDIWTLYQRRCEELLKPREVKWAGEIGLAGREIISALHESLRVLAADVLDPIISSIHKRLAEQDTQTAGLTGRVLDLDKEVARVLKAQAELDGRVQKLEQRDGGGDDPR